MCSLSATINRFELRDLGTLIATVHFSQVIKRKYQLLCVSFDMVWIQCHLCSPPDSLSGKEKLIWWFYFFLKKTNSQTYKVISLEINHRSYSTYKINTHGYQFVSSGFKWTKRDYWNEVENGQNVSIKWLYQFSVDIILSGIGGIT